MLQKIEKPYLYPLLVFGFCVGISACLFPAMPSYASSKQTNESNTEALATAQQFEHVFENVVNQVKPAVVSITSVKTFKHSPQKQRQMPNDRYHSQPPR